MNIIVKRFSNGEEIFSNMCTCDCACNCNVVGGLGGDIVNEIECARKGKYTWGKPCNRYTPRD